MRKNFQKSKVSNEIIKIMRNFITACIRLNPQDRPDIDQVLQHRLFGGPDLFLTKANDVWIKKVEFSLLERKFKEKTIFVLIYTCKII